MEKYMTPYNKEIIVHKWSLIHVFKEVVLSLYRNNSSLLEFTKSELLIIIMANLEVSDVYLTLWNKGNKDLTLNREYFFECRASVFIDIIFKNEGRKSLETIYIISTLMKYIPQY